jgi:hypothetical protein
MKRLKGVLGAHAKSIIDGLGTEFDSQKDGKSVKQERDRYEGRIVI